MHRIAGLVFLALIIGACHTGPRADFKRAASEIRYFGPGDFLFGFREVRRQPRENADSVQRFAAMLANKQFPVATLIGLLSDSSPRVRTLAIAALFSKGDPKLLPHLLPLVDDGADSFLDIVPTANFIMPNASHSNIPTKKQTVGNFASAAITFYLDGSGFYYGLRDFDAYWDQRKNRSYAAGWFAVELARASHGTYPTPVSRRSEIKEVRRRIEAIPEPDRTMTLLWLHGEAGADELTADDDLVGLARALGPRTLMGILRRNPPSNDPDLEPRKNNNGPYARMCVFILKNAKDLLRFADAATLLEQEKWERDFQRHGITDPLISPWWAVGAAQLDAARADSILYGAPKNSDHVLRCKMTSERGVKNGQETEADRRDAEGEGGLGGTERRQDDQRGSVRLRGPSEHGLEMEALRFGGAAAVILGTPIPERC